MPPIFAIISFCGYRYFREFIYFKVVRDVYESLCIAAFLCLMLMFLSNSPKEQGELLATKDKRNLVFPFCCFRFRASKPYFIHAVKWSVLQFVIVKPALAIAAIITEALGVFCETSQSFAFANVYIEIVDFVCITIALYGLIILYTLIHDEIADHRPLSKFLTIKVIVALVFYQGFIFTLLEHFNVIKPTLYWTTTNISDGLNALATTVEMVFIALFQLYAFPASEYKPEIKDDRPHTSFWRSFIHSQNYSDFVLDIFYSIKFFFDSLLGKAYTKATPTADSSGGNSFDLWKAFDYHAEAYVPPKNRTGIKEDDLRPIDPQRPYITPLSWKPPPVAEDGHVYPPTYNALVPQVPRLSYQNDPQGRSHLLGKGRGGNYNRLEDEDD